MGESPRLPRHKRPRSLESRSLKAATLDPRRRKAHKSKHYSDVERSASVRQSRDRRAPTRKVYESDSENEHSTSERESNDYDAPDSSDGHKFKNNPVFVRSIRERNDRQNVVSTKKVSEANEKNNNEENLSDKDEGAKFSESEDEEEIRSTQPTQPRKNKLTGNEILGDDDENSDEESAKRDPPFTADADENDRFKNSRTNFDDEDSDDEDGVLAQALQAQTEYAKDKSILRVTPGKKYSRDESDHSVSEHDVTSFEDLWMLELSKYDDKYFDTEEAQMAAPVGIVNTGTGGQRKKPYKGVGVNKENNKDIAFVCQYLYTEKGDTYENFKIAVGQLARLAIAANCVEKNDLWDSGEFFKVCSNKYLFQLFIGHFENESTGGTVMNKAIHLRNFVDQAINYYSIKKTSDFSQEAQEKRSRKMAKMQLVYSFLRHKAAKGKRVARLDKAARKESEHKKKVGRALTEDDVVGFRRRVVEKLSDIVRTFNSRCKERGAREVHAKYEVAEDLLKGKTLRQKWGINMTMLLLWFGQGQRNQVYCSMEAPPVNALEHFKNMKGGTKAKEPLEIALTRREKTKRSNTLPNILYDPIILPFLIFHVKYVLRYLRKEHEIPTGDKRRDLLLLHTENGRMLKEKQILRSLKSWIAEVDKDLHLTVMDVRAAYASFMMQKYARDADDGGDAFKNLEKDVFLQMIADIMNTSKEQLNNVYMASVDQGFKTTVAGLIGIVNKDEGQGGNEKPRSDLLDMVEDIGEEDD